MYVCEEIEKEREREFGSKTRMRQGHLLVTPQQDCEPRQSGHRDSTYLQSTLTKLFYFMYKVKKFQSK